jgi:hypothetical protein
MSKDIAFYDRISQSIGDCGWMLIGVLPDPDEDNIPFTIDNFEDKCCFIYTIGNYECGLPELLMIGCISGGTLNKIVARITQRQSCFHRR